MFPLSAIAAIAIFPRVYFLPNRWRRLFAVLFLLGVAPCATAMEMQLRIEDIVAPNFSLQDIQARVALTGSGLLDVRIGQATLQNRTWQNVALRCDKPQITQGMIACSRGLLLGEQTIPMQFRYWPSQRRLNLQLQPETGEQWQVHLQWNTGKAAADVSVVQGKIARLNAWLPAQWLQLGQGVFDMQAHIDWKRAGESQFASTLRLHQGYFGNATGTRAGEKLEAVLQLTGQQRQHWEWQGDLQWQSGEMYWQPLYFASGSRRLRAQGEYSPAGLSFRNGELSWEGIGDAVLNAEWDRASGKFLNWSVMGTSLTLDNLYPTFIKPFMPAGILQQLQMRGTADGHIVFQQGKLQELGWATHRATIAHEAQRFVLEGVEGDLGWHRTAARSNRFRIAGGQMGKLDLGTFSVQAEVAPERVVVAPLRLPILDGMLNVEQIDAKRVNNQWQWSLSAALQPISMERLSQALQWPTMHGALSAIIPEVRYEHQGLQVEGALLFKVFDGSVVVRDLSVSDILSPTPHVQADVDIRDLDLSLLTNTFSFGSIQGRLDGTVDDLELFAWKPVRFDAKVSSSAGEYPRKISQRAVQNITALGGGGGAAALQRSFLGFFDQFGYKSIGISCRLANGICEMGGLHDAPNGFVLVEGGGIPALTVIGYNRQVDWNELVGRLQRITKGSKPLVQ